MFPHACNSRVETVVINPTQPSTSVICIQFVRPCCSMPLRLQVFTHDLCPIEHRPLMAESFVLRLAVARVSNSAPRLLWHMHPVPHLMLSLIESRTRGPFISRFRCRLRIKRSNSAGSCYKFKRSASAAMYTSHIDHNRRIRIGVKQTPTCLEHRTLQCTILRSHN